MEYYTELYHWGIKGMKWGVRRYQNKDGSLTPAGKKRLRAKESANNEPKKVKANPIRDSLNETGKKNYDILHANDKSASIKGGLLGAGLVTPMTLPVGLFAPGAGTAVAATVTAGWSLIGAEIGSNIAQNKIIKSVGETEANKFKSMQHLETRINADRGKSYVDDIVSANNKYIDKAEAAIKNKVQNNSDAAKARYEQERSDRNAYYANLYKDIANEKLKPGKDYTFEHFYDGATEITQIRRTSDGSLLYNYQLTTHYY